MARGKAISVKIATAKVIKSLEVALAKLESNYKNQEANEEKFKKSVEKWQKDVQKLVLANLKNIEDFSASSNYRNDVRVSFCYPAGTLKLPAEPIREVETISGWAYKEQKDEMENAIRILKMTDEEVVSTSTYNAIARYL